MGDLNLRDQANALWAHLHRGQRGAIFAAVGADPSFPLYGGIDDSPEGRYYWASTVNSPSPAAQDSIGDILAVVGRELEWTDDQFNAAYQAYITAITNLPPYPDAERQAHEATCAGCAASHAYRAALASGAQHSAAEAARVCAARAARLGNPAGSAAAGRCAMRAWINGCGYDCCEYAPLAAARAIIAGCAPALADAAGDTAVLAYTTAENQLRQRGAGEPYIRVQSRLAAEAAGEVIASGGTPAAAAAAGYRASRRAEENSDEENAQPAAVGGAGAAAAAGGGGGAAAAWPSIAACAPPTVLNVRRSQLNIDVFTQEPFVQGQVVVRFDGNNNMMADAAAQDQFWAAEAASGRRPRSPFRQPPPVLVQGDFALFTLNIQEDEEEPSNGASGSKRKRGAGGEGSKRAAGGKRGAGTAWENRFRQTGKRKLRKVQRKTRKGIKRRLLKTRKR